ncbi:TRAP dicarboxylate transporter, DctM subunit, unknown substrate 6 [uncultured Gammaproteobacteria bacterium]|nr:TRAP dicarboxylate transporter, DctM subunit, unknown substrate 6 [uncultured Gammaproteobacteria bacterium]
MIGLVMFGYFIITNGGLPCGLYLCWVAVIFGVLTQGVDLFGFMPYRIMSVMQNTILMAVPLFIFMGIVLQKTKLAEQLLEAMGDLFGNVRGGLAVSTILVGSLLAASTGVVGASVVAMGVISLPVMLKHNYKKTLSTGDLRLWYAGADYSTLHCFDYFGRCAGCASWGFVPRGYYAFSGAGRWLYYLCLGG